MPSIFDIPEFKAGEDVRDLRDQLNRVRLAICALQPLSSPDITPMCTANGTTWRSTRKPAGGASHPFKVVDASTSAPAAKVTVIFGQVNNVTPTIGGVALDNATPPALTVVSGVVYLDCTVNGSGVCTSAIVSNAASVPADTATHGYRVLATVTVASNAVTAINQSITHSLGHQKCGTTTHNFWGV